MKKAAAKTDEAMELNDLDSNERIDLLERALNRQLAYVLTHPVEDLSRRVKEIKAAMDVLDGLKGKDAGNALIVSFDE
ncbi:hypothetical protein LJB82_02725 [Desulfovibrio sp. OttesenSCG-928-M16]|nr:hypothetical protein [Desulfovibrio sp. OttesenSCG-928-M16]